MRQPNTSFLAFLVGQNMFRGKNNSFCLLKKLNVGNDSRKRNNDNFVIVWVGSVQALP